MTKTTRLLVTHARPHLDDVAAAWLLKKFHPDFSAARLRFLKRHPNGEFRIPRGAVAIGIGRGQFDEHKGDLGDCATTLVWQWLRRQSRARITPIMERAVDQLVGYVLQGDLGQLNAVPWRAWSIGEAFFGYADRAKHRDQKVFRFGIELLESALVGLVNRNALEADWNKRIEFPTPWGKGMGIETSNSEVFGRAYEDGFVLVCRIHPEKGFRQIRADANSAVDLSDAYARVKRLEPRNASWFLHHSKRLLLCGSSSAANFTPSRLSLRDLIGLVRLGSRKR